MWFWNREQAASVCGLSTGLTVNPEPWPSSLSSLLCPLPAAEASGGPAMKLAQQPSAPLRASQLPAVS